jgi:hypothetical protein
MLIMIKNKLDSKNNVIKKAIFQKQADNIFTIKVNKSIEIVIVPNLGEKNPIKIMLELF